MTGRPWLALPYGHHVDALIAATKDLYRDQWQAWESAHAAVVARTHFPLGLTAWDAVEDDLGARRTEYLIGALYDVERGAPTGFPIDALESACAVLCAAHLIGRRGLTAAGIRIALSPALTVPELAEALRPALAQLGAVTAGGVS